MGAGNKEKAFRPAENRGEKITIHSGNNNLDVVLCNRSKNRHFTQELLYALTAEEIKTFLCRKMV